MFFINKNRSFYTFTHLCVFCRDTRRLLEKLVYVPSKDFPVTVVQVASWYLLRHLHAKNDLELMNVSTQLSHLKFVCGDIYSLKYLSNHDFCGNNIST